MEKNVMNRTEQALAYYQEGYNCAQSVYTPFAEKQGVDRDTALKTSAGFGGGMGRLANTCGAVSGAFMALGLKYGSTAPGPEIKAAMYAIIQEFAQRFKACNECLECRDLLGLDLSIPEEAERIRAENLPAKLCPKFIQDAAEILEEML